MKTAGDTQTFPARAFTLIELMMVVAIIGLIMAMGIPPMLQAFHKEGIRKAVDDVINVCSAARSEAILQGRTVEVVFRPEQGQLSIVGAAPAPNQTGSVESDSKQSYALGSAPGRTTSATLPNNVSIDMLDINLMECVQMDEAFVHFYPNGTCDEMTMVLHSGAAWRKISLEFSTSIASAEAINK
jgi:prepilin-type N-terminal cleavage/methylation domain-containing protein